MAATNTCNGRVVSTNNSSKSVAYLLWLTDTNGDIVIRLIGNNADPATAFRGDGMQRNGFYYERAATQQSFLLTDSMTASMNNAQTEIRWKKKNGFEPKVGDIIHFNTGKNIEWKTTGEPNAWHNAYSFEYTYGQTCDQLPTPTIQSISSDGTIQFTIVEEADAYLAYIYQNDLLLETEVITNGGVLSFTSYNAYTYSVRLQALGWSSSSTHSDLSPAVDWTPAAQSLPNSTLCGKKIGSGSSAMYLSWQTDEHGNIVISIDGDEGTFFRANGMSDNSLNRFMIGDNPASTYFTREYYGDNSSTFTLKLKEGTFLPYGTKVRFSGTIEWKTTNNNNAYGDYSMDYIYGTSCPSLSAPTIQQITEDKVILFDPVENATSYVTSIYREDLLVHTQIVAPADTILFNPISSASYNVYLTAKSTTHQPATSITPYVWYLEGSEEDIDMSTICDKMVSRLNGGIYLSIETDEEGYIHFTLSGSNSPTWRGTGLQTDLLTIQGSSIQNFFDKLSDYEHTPTITLVPKLGSLNIRQGDIIKYRGNIEWFVTEDGVESSPWVSDFTFDYVYGSRCTPLLPRLETPSIVSIDSEGGVQYTEVINAATYLAYIYDEDEVHIDNQTIDTNTGIQKSPSVIPGFSYWVRIQAWPELGSEEYRESKLSEAFEWYFPILTDIHNTQADKLIYRLYTIEGYLVHEQCTRDQLKELNLHGIYILQNPSNSQIILLP